jgi:hypothetical protein
MPANVPAIFLGPNAFGNALGNSIVGQTWQSSGGQQAPTQAAASGGGQPGDAYATLQAALAMKQYKADEQADLNTMLSLDLPSAGTAMDAGASGADWSGDVGMRRRALDGDLAPLVAGGVKVPAQVLMGDSNAWTTNSDAMSNTRMTIGVNEKGEQVITVIGNKLSMASQMAVDFGDGWRDPYDINRSIMDDKPATIAETTGRYSSQAVDSFKNFGMNVTGVNSMNAARADWRAGHYTTSVLHGMQAFGEAGTTVLSGGTLSTARTGATMTAAELTATRETYITGQAAIRERVLANIEESRAARASSNFNRFNEWPSNNGFVEGLSERYTLWPGQLVDRYGSTQGTFVAEYGTSYQAKQVRKIIVTERASTKNGPT